MTLSEELTWRGFVNQTTLTDIAKLDSAEAGTFYHGYDASADSFTVGNLAGLMVDRVFMRHGYKAVILAGGATSLIGDPGGKDSERPMQDEAVIAANIEGIKAQMTSVFADQEFTLVNNLDWTKDLTVLRFLRDIGRHFSMSNLVQRDYIARRLGEGGTGISFTEFSYSLLQGMDFLHLYDEYGCTLQVGSSDQWSNCLSGIDLIRKVRGKEAHVLTHPLVINNVTGKKFGKSETGAVWLDPARTSPNDFYQFWFNIDDAGVEGYLKVYTLLSKEELDAVMVEFNANKPQRAAQKKLAYEVTELVHGHDAAVAAQEYAEGLRSASISGTARIVSNEFGVEVGSSILDALYGGNLIVSKSEGRKLLASGGIYLNDQQIDRDDFRTEDFTDGEATLRRGKKLQNTLRVTLK